MSEEESGSEKQHEPTQKKLDDARKKGEVAKSTDLTTAAAYGGFVLTAAAIGSGLIGDFGSTLQNLVANADLLSADLFAGGVQPIVGGILMSAATAVAPFFGIPAAAAILAVIAQQAFVVAPSKLEPKLNRISPISNAKNKFGRSGMFEFAKSFAKLLIFSIVLGVFLIGRTPEIATSVMLEPAPIAAVLADMAFRFMLVVVVVAAAIGAIDLMWQKAEHLRKNRMSRKELTDEAKQSEGDPHVKQQRRQRGQEIALNQMMADVPDADVIIVNPTHYAVALKWDRSSSSAPSCVAKGTDEIAWRIREIAHESGVPIQRDPATARALFAALNIGDEIWPEHYRAVAAAIRFAEAMRKKAGNLVWKT